MKQRKICDKCKGVWYCDSNSSDNCNTLGEYGCSCLECILEDSKLLLFSNEFWDNVKSHCYVYSINKLIAIML